MLTVHHLNNSRSQRVLWLLEEIGTPYELKIYQRNPLTKRAPPELRKVHPLGKSPVLTDDDLVIAESAVILEYLVENYAKGKLKPASGSIELMRFNYFMHYAEGSMMSPLIVKLIFDEMEKAPVPFFVKPIVKEISKQIHKAYIDYELTLALGFLDREIDDREWFTGSQFTAADVQMSFPLEAAQARKALDQRYPNLLRFLESIRSRPAYQKALAKGGPFSLA